MKVLGIIAEYNPFHNGHFYHLAQSIKKSNADYTIVVMSGNFTQRGEPALLDKWARAETAVRCGVDLVVELPTYYATMSAQGFAFGAVSLLDKLGVDVLSFGAENDDLAELTKIAELLYRNTAEFNAELASHMQRGLRYHQALEATVNNMTQTDIALKSNNILAIAYLRVLLQLGSAIKPLPIKRVGSDYRELTINKQYTSATAIRQQLTMYKPIDWLTVKRCMPSQAYQLLYRYPKYSQLNDYKAILNAVVFREGSARLRAIRGVNEGLENRVLANLSNTMSLDDVVSKIESKRYNTARIQRLLIDILLNIEEEKMSHHLDYARILAFRQASGDLMRHLKRNSRLTMLTNLGRDLKKYRRANPLISLDTKATALYSQICHAVNLRSDFSKHPIAVCEPQINWSKHL